MSDPVVTPRASWSFMVWRKTPRDPRFRHQSAEAAQAEAEMLARRRPGQTFFVLQEHSRVCAGDDAKGQDGE